MTIDVTRQAAGSYSRVWKSHRQGYGKCVSVSQTLEESWKGQRVHDLRRTQEYEVSDS